MDRLETQTRTTLAMTLAAALLAALAGQAHSGVVINAAPGFNITWDGNDGRFFNAADPAPVPPNLGNAPGTSPFGSGQLGVGPHFIPTINDSRYGNSNSWIGGEGDPAPYYIGVALAGLQPVTAIAWGRDNGNNVTDACGGQCTDRWQGVYTIQATTDPNPAATAAWTTLGTLDYQSADDAVVGGAFTPWFRHEYAVSTSTGDPIQATGVRLVVPATGWGGTAVDELEVYSPTVVSSPVTLTPAAGYAITWDGNDGDYFEPNVPAQAPPNVARITGVAAFGSSAYPAPAHTIAHANDGLYGNANSWLANPGDPDPYIALNLNGEYPLTGIAWGRDNGNSVADACGGQCTDRALDLYTLQITRVANPGLATPDTGDPATGWADVGTLNYLTDDDAVPGGAFTSYFRHQYGLALDGQPVQATGIRIKPSSNATAIDEIELYQAMPVPSTGLSSWLRADAGILNDPSGNVETWADQSGNTLDAVQTVAAFRPTAVPDALAGKPVVDFSAPGIRHLNIMDAPALGMQSSDYEIFVVARTSSQAIQFITAGSHTAGYENYELHLNGSAGARFIPNQASTSTPDKFADLGGPGIFAVGLPVLFNVRVDGGTGYLAVNGLTSSDVVTDARSASDRWLTIGVRGNASFPLDGQVAEVLVYGRTLSPAERAQIERALMAKWQVPLNVAAASRGATAFAKDLLGDPDGDGVSIYAAHRIDNLNDEWFGNSDSWIGATQDSFAGVAFARPEDIYAIAFGRDNGGEATQFTDRFLGTYTLQYTTVADPNAATSDADWLTIALLQYDGAFPDAQGYLRHLYEFSPVSGATGVRILAQSLSGGFGDLIAIDEIEVYAVPIPEPATLALLGLGLLGLARRPRRR